MFLEFIANMTIEQGSAPTIKGNPMFVPRRPAEQAPVLSRFAHTKMRPQKWIDATRNFWTSKCEGLVPATKNDGAIAVLLAALFLVGMGVGGVLSTHQSQPVQIASIE
jgi:hypothetical protein